MLRQLDIASQACLRIDADASKCRYRSGHGAWDRTFVGIRGRFEGDVPRERVSGDELRFVVTLVIRGSLSHQGQIASRNREFPWGPSIEFGLPGREFETVSESEVIPRVVASAVTTETIKTSNIGRRFITASLPKHDKSIDRTDQTRDTTRNPWFGSRAVPVAEDFVSYAEGVSQQSPGSLRSTHPGS